jgi:hypothetical protein
MDVPDPEPPEGAGAGAGDDTGAGAPKLLGAIAPGAGFGPDMLAIAGFRGKG